MTRPYGLASAYLLFLLTAPTTLAFEADFNFYPLSSQSCLYDSATTSGCKGDTSAALNNCLCGNGGNFVLLSAQCLGKSDQSNVENVYDTMSTACSTSRTPLQVSKDDFMGVASGDSPSGSSSTSATASKTASSSATGKASTTLASTTSSRPSWSPSPATPSPTPATPSPTPAWHSNDSHGLDTDATIGVAVGASVAGIAAVAALVLFLVRRRKQRNNAADEAHPMLPHEKYGSGGATTFPPNDPSLGMGTPGSDHKSKAHFSVSSCGSAPAAVTAVLSTHNSPDPERQSFLSWEQANSGDRYSGPYAPSQGVVAELPPDTRQQRATKNVFELDSGRAAALQSQQSPTYYPYKPK